MIESTTAPVLNATNHYFQDPYSLFSYSDDFRNGLWALAVVGSLSALSSLSLLCFIGSRFITWKKHYRTYIGYNQYVVLIINLLLADFQQATCFVLSFHWLKEGAILAPSTQCFAQGWFLNIGDVASGVFVLFIATHTFLCAVKGYRISHKIFVAMILCVWVFAVFMSALGPIMYGNKYYVRAGSWCWVSSEYERERLALHYIWIFMVQFTTVIIYVLVLLHLKKTMQIILPAAAQSDTYAKVDRAARLMVLYPLTYILLTLPLSAGRMWSMAHHSSELPNTYAFVAGCLISSSGWVDALLYTLTRKHLISGSKEPRSSHPSSNKKSGNGHFETSRSGNFSKANAIVSASQEDAQPWSSLADGRIAQTRTVTVTGGRASMGMDGSPAYEMDEFSDRGRRLSVPRMGLGRHHRSGSAEPIITEYGYHTAYAGGPRLEISPPTEASEGESLKSDAKSMEC